MICQIWETGLNFFLLKVRKIIFPHLELRTGPKFEIYKIFQTKIKKEINIFLILVQNRIPDDIFLNLLKICCVNFIEN